MKVYLVIELNPDMNVQQIMQSQSGFHPATQNPFLIFNAMARVQIGDVTVFGDERKAVHYCRYDLAMPMETVVNDGQTRVRLFSCKTNASRSARLEEVEVI